MSTPSLVKKQYIALQPEGILGNVKADSDEDHMYDGLAEDFENLKLWMTGAGNLRDPLTTPILEDLEFEYGIKPDPVLTEDERRAQLDVLVYAKDSDGDKDGLEENLVRAGFVDAKVFDNNPAVDTTTLSVEYILNGDMFVQYMGFVYRCKDYSDPDRMTCTTFADKGTCGSLEDTKLLYVFEPSGTSDSMIFFVCKSLTRDGGGLITGIVPLDIPLTQRDMFLRTVLRYKRLDTWCALAVNWVDESEWQDVNAGVGIEDIQDVNAGVGIEDIQDVNA